MSRAITFIRSLRRADLWPGPHLHAQMSGSPATWMMKSRSTSNQPPAASSPKAMRRKRLGGWPKPVSAMSERIKRLPCANIALKEQLMQQRVNFILMIAVVLLLIGIGVQTIVGYRQECQGPGGHERYGRRNRASAGGQRRGAAAAREHGPVYLDGDVARPGMYTCCRRSGASPSGA